MTLTVNLVMWILIAAHCLIMIIICAKLFSNPTMHNKVMGQTRTDLTEVYAQSLSAGCAFDLWPSDMVLFSTNRLFMMIICAKLFLIPPYITKLRVGHEQVSLKSMHKD